MSDTDANITRRADANDPLTMCQEGLEQAKKGNIRRAFEYLTKAESDKRMGGKFLYHLEEATIGGRPDARFRLACCEERKGRIDRAVKHSTSSQQAINIISINCSEEDWSRNVRT